MPSNSRRSLVIICAAALAACATSQDSAHRSVSAPFSNAQGTASAPFGDQVSRDILNYTRAAPQVGTAGSITPAGVAEAKALGFRLIIDLRQPNEDGVTEERTSAQRAEINYLNIPLAADERAWQQVATIDTLLADPDNLPALIHCGSANRAGALWALYRSQQGVDPVVAIEEGRTVGLRDREPVVRTLLNLPQLP